MKWWSPTPWAVCEHQAWTFDVGWTPKFLQVVQVCLDPASVDGKTMHPLTLGYMTTLSGPIVASRTGKSMRDYLTLGYGYNYYIHTIYCITAGSSDTTKGVDSYWQHAPLIPIHDIQWFSYGGPWSQSFHLFVYRIYLQKAWKLDCTRTEAQHDRNQVQVSQDLDMFDPSRIPTTLGRQSHNAGGFLPAVKQIGNVAALPGPLQQDDRKVVDHWIMSCG